MMISTELTQEVRQIAHSIYSQRPDWVTFYRDVLGLNGAVRRCFPSKDMLAEFEKTEAYDDIQTMLHDLRKSGHTPANAEDPTEVITVRLPRSMHAMLREEAHEHRTSINKLCITKLLKFIDGNPAAENLGLAPDGD
jgi:predicted HicB family RNase H-like nuclease